MLGMVLGTLVTVTAAKTVDVFGTPYSITIFYFPVIYVISDLLTEVYGYALARRALWYLVAARLLTIVIISIAAWAPPAQSMQNNAAYISVFAQAPIIMGVQIVSLFAGDVVNNYIVARMKVASNGRHITSRFVVSAAASELVNSFIFYFFALGLTGVIPFTVLAGSIIGATLFKTMFELALLPVSIPLARKLKQIEGFDVFDRDTDFNPLRL